MQQLIDLSEIEFDEKFQYPLTDRGGCNFLSEILAS